MLGKAVGPLRDSDSMYVPQGKVYLQKPPSPVWTVLAGTDTLRSTIRMTRFKEDGAGFLSLHYQIEIVNYPTVFENKILTVLENSTYNAHYGSAAIFREFTCLGLDSNLTVHISLTHQHPNWTETWSSSAAGKLIDTLGTQTFILRDEHVSQVKVSFGDSL